LSSVIFNNNKKIIISTVKYNSISTILCSPISEAFTPVFGGVRVANLFSVLCCPIMCLKVLSSVLWCLLRLSHKNDVLCVFSSRLCVVCGCLCVVMSNVYCSVFFLYLMYPMLPVSLECPLLIGPSIFSNVYFIPQLRKQFIFHIFRNSFLVLSEKRSIKTVSICKCNVAITTKRKT
jgi:hypothetical protein